MQELEIILNSDLCAGNGESAGNSIDSDVCIDDAGIPYIPSRRIKGCLKQAAFDLKKMGYTLASDSNIIDLFGDAYGNEGAFSICDAMIKDANGIRQYLNTEIKNSDNSDEIKDMAHASKIVNLFTSVRGQTMLDDGCKVDNSLRFTRGVNQYDPLSLDKDEKLAFYAPIYFNFCDDDKKKLRELFDACCKATRHIGHSRNRGLGNVSIKLCEDGAKQVNMLFTENDNKADIDCSEADKPVKISYKVVLNSPLTLPGCDELNTSVPARSVIGCMAGYYLHSGSAKDEDFRKLFLDGTVSWSGLTPVIEGEISVPVPMMIVRLKNGGNKLINNLMEKDDAWKKQKPKTLDGSFTVQTQNGYKIAEPSIHTYYHYAINGTQQDDNNNENNTKMLYMQESIDAGAVYGGTIICPVNMKDKVLKCLYEARIQFGRSKSAQYATCSLYANPEVEEYKNNIRHVKTGEKMYVVLQSDLALLDTGVYRTDSACIREAIGKKLNLSSDIAENSLDYCRYHVIGGFQSTWQLQKPQIPVVRAGSVYCFKVKEECDIPQTIRIGEFAQEGMGICGIMTVSDFEKVSSIEMSRIEQAHFTVDNNRIEQLLTRLKMEAIMEHMRSFALKIAEAEVTKNIPEARLRNMVSKANDYSDLNKMILKIKESDLSSEKKLSRKAEATKFVEIIKTEWNAQLKLYDLDHNLINQIEANWKKPLNIALHKYHYQKERG